MYTSPSDPKQRKKVTVTPTAATTNNCKSTSANSFRQVVSGKSFFCGNFKIGLDSDKDKYQSLPRLGWQSHQRQQRARPIYDWPSNNQRLSGLLFTKVFHCQTKGLEKQQPDPLDPNPVHTHECNHHHQLNHNHPKYWGILSRQRHQFPR